MIMHNKLLASVVLATALPLAGHAANSDFPLNGQTFEIVLSQFGEPEQKVPAVGNPPITRWIYPGYTVYFEHRLVIHSVKNR